MAAVDHTYVLSPDGEPLYFGDLAIVWDLTMLEDLRARYGLVAYTQDDYMSALVALLPQGAAWPMVMDSVLHRLLRAWAAEFERLDQRAAQLLSETDPAATAEMLSDWERVVGLPDPCVTTTQTVAERRQALEGRLTSVGGQSRDFFIQLAARLGYTVTIDEFPSAAAATAAGTKRTWFRAGSGAAGEPISSWGNEALECQFNRFKPAHTQVLFAYTGA